ncbi:putative secreted protein [Psilocybe cubensis]|uniref:GmrSD restriction endonucleases C-terminal domain-containing protein n=2 Tax=Psilocybe cubensis TaxID=181762 RepID=A0A8H7XQL8_PSICU|nr:putative secreted protein [Psilocybe cubensis]KAH9475468.1 putative secreted protein [Psilocybe cubensis]
MRTSLLSVLAVAAAISSSVASVLPRALPTPVSVATAKTYLAALTVEAESNSPAYNRDLFKHWTTVSGSCNTRETVLKRDGTNVVVGSNCAATSGSWVSPYDNVPTNLASDLDIDHVVPLKEAWVSGARTWTNAQREAFANDLVRPQLIAVTDSLNQAKGDKDPAEWMVPLASYRCTYVRAWIHVKYHYKLSVDQAEKTALTNYINAC